MEAIDELISARWIIPIEPASVVLEHHTIAVKAGRILGVFPEANAQQRFTARTQTELPNHVVIPGLVNLHAHSAMTLMRGLADDLPLMKWLGEHIWPAEAKHVSPEFVYDGTLLAAAEMVRGGITCCNDMYFFPEDAGRAFAEAKMRAALGLIVIDFPTAYANDPADYLHKGLAMRDALKHEPLLSYCIAPHAPYTVGDKTFEQVVTLADELDLPIHLHVHETQDEIREGEAKYGARPLARLHRLGVLGPNLIAVHSVHLSPAEIEQYAALGVSVAHCPSSNLKLASGFAPTPALLEAGVNTGLGTDGAASNNRLDMFQEIRTAALCAKALSGRADVLGAMTALRMATLHGARALGLEKEIGSIEAGKSADLCAVAMDSLELTPCYHPASHLVYACAREHVSDVWVAGNRLLRNRQLTHIDQARLKAKAVLWQTKLMANA
jgi:5-methylthioadenosine/S-adenosylhomocysteine deaminase